MNAIYFITCISGRGKGTIDITEIPTGDYYIFVYNETSNEINLNGTVAFNFNYVAVLRKGSLSPISHSPISHRGQASPVFRQIGKPGSKERRGEGQYGI